MCCSAMLLIAVIAEATSSSEAASGGGGGSGGDGGAERRGVSAPAMAGHFVGFVHQLQEVGLLTGCRKPGHAAASLHRPPDYDDNEEEPKEWAEISREIERLLRQEDKELHAAILKGQAAHSAAQTLGGDAAAGNAQAATAPAAAAAAAAAAAEPGPIGSSADHWREFAWTTIRPRMRRLWTGAVTTEAQLFIVDTCLLAGTSTAMARIAAVDLLCRKEIFLGSQHSRRAMQDALRSGALLDRPAIRHAIDLHGFANEMRKVAGVPELPSQARERQNSRPPVVAPLPDPTPPVPVPAPVRPLTPPEPPEPTKEELDALKQQQQAQQAQQQQAQDQQNDVAASRIQSAWRGKAIRKLKIIQRATDTTSIMKSLLSTASSSMRQLSGTPEPGGL
jgi:hypothetical protein